MKSLEELQAIRAKMKTQLQNRGTVGSDDINIVVGMSTCGISAGARKVLNVFSEEIERKHIKNVKLGQTGCIGLCQMEPIVEVSVPGQPKVTYVQISAEKAKEIVLNHIINGQPCKGYTLSMADAKGESK